jgi:hypothetical protein
MAMQAKHLLLIIALAFAGTPAVAADERRADRPDDRDGRRGGPNITVEPYIDLNRHERPNVDEPSFIMAELEACVARGVRLIVECLRPNHRPVMIRRLESCVFSETIPDDPREIAGCLPPARVR